MPCTSSTKTLNWVYYAEMDLFDIFYGMREIDWAIIRFMTMTILFSMTLWNLMILAGLCILGYLLLLLDFIYNVPLMPFMSTVMAGGCGGSSERPLIFPILPRHLDRYVYSSSEHYPALDDEQYRFGDAIPARHESSKQVRFFCSNTSKVKFFANNYVIL